MPDMRTELLVMIQDKLYHPVLGEVERVGAVLDSIPPGSYKLDEKTWVRLEKRDSDEYDRLFDHYAVCEQGVKGGCGDCTKYARTYLKETFYTEVDHAE